MAEPEHPPPYRTDEASLARDTDMDIHTGGGPGGQHRNKTQTAVRLHHRPSGLIVTATERRSLDANKKAAFERLVERLERLNVRPRVRRPTKPSRGSVQRRLTQKTRDAKVKTTRTRARRDED